MVKIYGKYCGPGWTAGKKRDAADTPVGEFTRVKPIDALDDACLLHDWECRKGGCSKAADRRLMSRAIAVSKDPKESKKTRAAAALIADGMLLTSFIRLK